jgi:alpha-L-fucosidase
MNNRGITAAEYERIPPLFQPSAFDPAAWVSLARAAGMRYLVMTAKHHDGLAMWDTRTTDWNVARRTPYGRDVMRLLADECRRQGMPLVIYYSQLDWHHPDYFPRGGTGRTAARPDSGNWDRYLDFMDAQLRELLTGYGPVAGVWLDGFWDRGDADWRLARTYRMIRELQPGALIISNHNGPPHEGEDVITFEQYVRPEHVPPGSTLPLEVSAKINDTWGFRLWDRDYKSVDSLVRTMVRAAGQGANFLLNVGPMPDGRIQPEFVERIEGVGRWMTRYGPSIHGTRAGPVAPRPWGVTTQRGDTVFVHVLSWPDRLLTLPPLPRQVTAARSLRDGAVVAVTQDSAGVRLVLPDRGTEPDVVVALTLSSAGRAGSARRAR